MSQEKQCRDCGETKPLDEFYLRNRRLKNGDVVRHSYCRPCLYKRAEVSRLKRWYGLTPQEHTDLKRGGCQNAECKNPKPKLCVDHDHATKGKTRGVLCDNCNKALGLLGDNAEAVRGLLAYIEAANYATKREEGLHAAFLELEMHEPYISPESKTTAD